jgi:drug/metabolite transporter (DMT)-like permease
LSIELELIQLRHELGTLRSQREQDERGSRLAALFAAGGILLAGVSAGIGVFPAWRDPAELAGGIISSMLVGVLLAGLALLRPSKRRILVLLLVGGGVALVAWLGFHQQGFGFAPIALPFLFAAGRDVAYLAHTDHW